MYAVLQAISYLKDSSFYWGLVQLKVTLVMSHCRHGLFNLIFFTVQYWLLLRLY